MRMFLLSIILLGQIFGGSLLQAEDTEVNIEAIGIRLNNYQETGQTAVDIVKGALAEATVNESNKISFVVTSEFSFQPGYASSSSNTEKAGVAKEIAIRLRKLGDLYYIDKRDSNREVAGHLTQLIKLAKKYKITIFAGTFWTKISSPEYPNIPKDAVANTLIIINKYGQMTGIDFKAVPSDGVIPTVFRNTSKSSPNYIYSQEVYSYMDKVAAETINVYTRDGHKLSVFPLICAEQGNKLSYVPFRGAKADLMVMSMSWLEPAEQYAESLQFGDNSYSGYFENNIQGSIFNTADEDGDFDLLRTDSVALFSDYNKGSVFRLDGNKIDAFKITDRYTYGKTYINKTYPSEIVSERGSFILKQKKSTRWNKVQLSKKYDDPVIIFSPLSHQDSTPANIRVKNVTATSFEWQIQESDLEDGKHAGEYVNYIVLEAGEYQLSNGRKLIAGNVLAGEKFTAHEFSSRFQSKPVVVGQVISASDSASVCVRLNNVSDSSFEIKLQGEEIFNKLHGAEKVSFVAVDPGQYNELGLVYAGSTGLKVNHKWFSIPFSTKSVPSFLAGIQTTVEDDPANIRMESLNSTGVKIKLKEEKSLDNEIKHARESVGYIIFKN